MKNSAWPIYSSSLSKPLHQRSQTYCKRGGSTEHSTVNPSLFWSPLNDSYRISPFERQLSKERWVKSGHYHRLRSKKNESQMSVRAQKSKVMSALLGNYSICFSCRCFSYIWCDSSQAFASVCNLFFCDQSDSSDGRSISAEESHRNKL